MYTLHSTHSCTDVASVSLVPDLRSDEIIGHAQAIRDKDFIQVEHDVDVAPILA